jgi:hypothetical protein
MTNEQIADCISRGQRILALVWKSQRRERHLEKCRRAIRKYKERNKKQE